MTDKTGFFKTLMDFSFSSLIAPKVVKFIYVIAIIACALSSLSIVITGFTTSVASGFLLLIFSPVIFVLMVIMARIYLELIIVIFRIAEDIQKIARASEKK